MTYIGNMYSASSSSNVININDIIENNLTIQIAIHEFPSNYHDTLIEYFIEYMKTNNVFIVHIYELISFACDGKSNLTDEYIRCLKRNFKENIDYKYLEHPMTKEDSIRHGWDYIQPLVIRLNTLKIFCLRPTVSVSNLKLKIIGECFIELYKIIKPNKNLSKPINYEEYLIHTPENEIIEGELENIEEQHEEKEEDKEEHKSQDELKDIKNELANIKKKFEDELKETKEEFKIELRKLNAQVKYNYKNFDTSGIVHEHVEYNGSKICFMKNINEHVFKSCLYYRSNIYNVYNVKLLEYIFENILKVQKVKLIKDIDLFILRYSEPRIRVRDLKFISLISIYNSIMHNIMHSDDKIISESNIILKDLCDNEGQHLKYDSRYTEIIIDIFNIMNNGIRYYFESITEGKLNDLINYKRVDTSGEIYILEDDSKEIYSIVPIKYFNSGNLLQTSLIKTPTKTYKFKTNDVKFLIHIVNNVLKDHCIEKNHFKCNLSHIEMIIQISNIMIDRNINSCRKVSREDIKITDLCLEENYIQFHPEVNEYIIDIVNTINSIKYSFRDIILED
jgi:hypothetical protein